MNRAEGRGNCPLETLVGGILHRSLWKRSRFPGEGVILHSVLLFIGFGSSRFVGTRDESDGRNRKVLCCITVSLQVVVEGRVEVFPCPAPPGDRLQVGGPELHLIVLIALMLTSC